MSSDKQTGPGTERAHGVNPLFVGEEDSGSRSSPAKDMLAAVVIGLFAIAAVSFAAALPVPENLLTAPALLPFLTALTLLAMAIGLGVKAMRAGDMGSELRKAAGAARRYVGHIETHRTWILMAVIVVYVVAVDLLAFEFTLPTQSFVLAFSSYELISGLTLTVLLRFFWGAAVTRCLLIAFTWVILLAAIFRYGFRILLPGLA